MAASASVAPAASDARATFLERLSQRLREKSYSLVSGEFGREAKLGVWVLTVRLANQHVQTVRAPVAPKDDPFAPEVCDDIARRVIAFLSK